MADNRDSRKAAIWDRIVERNSSPFGPHDMMQHMEFACSICLAMQDNCPTAEWRSWKFVPEDAKKAMMDELLCNYTLDEMNKELVKLIEEALKKVTSNGIMMWSGMEDQRSSYKFIFLRTIFIFKNNIIIE
ncbi:hypothetical protein DVH24_009967 [Malus domestica]|uniref:Uncharacterized protein n=1 Tax=Malus domestica TaxID=3750 RepID=A0A498JVZ0_MALDO|nr:hypothetical protein DVH24_009967 [Malus domestica]